MKDMRIKKMFWLLRFNDKRSLREVVHKSDFVYNKQMRVLMKHSLPWNVIIRIEY